MIKESITEKKAKIIKNLVTIFGVSDKEAIKWFNDLDRHLKAKKKKKRSK